MSDQPTLDQDTVMRVAALMLISWGGELIHNMFEFPTMGLLAPENSGPLLFSIILFVIWWQVPRVRHIALALIAAWTAVHFLIGAVITVIPFSFLPFEPEQSPGHYLSHVIYGLTQIPLLVYLYQQRRKPRAVS